MTDNTNTDQTDQRDADQTDQTDEQNEQSDELGDKGQAALKAERDARRKAEREAKALAAKVAEYENAGKSESEKIAAERDAALQRAEAAEQRIRTANARTAVYEAVGSLASPRAVFALIKDDLDFDDDDMPTNVADLIAREKKADPTLFRAAAGSGDGGKGGFTGKKEYGSVTERLAAGYAENSKASR